MKKFFLSLVLGLTLTAHLVRAIGPVEGEMTRSTGSSALSKPARISIDSRDPSYFNLSSL